jgi:hypothetical protein
MLNQQKLLQLIDADLQACDRANPVDEPGRRQRMLEHTTLIRHLQWAREAGDDQAVLEQIVQSLEKNMAVRYQRWREDSTV